MVAMSALPKTMRLASRYRFLDPFVFRIVPNTKAEFGRSSEELSYDFAGNVSQAVVPTLMFERQPFMINSQTVQHRGMQVVYMNRVVRDIVRKVVSFSERETRLNASASHPDCEATRMMVTTIILCG